MSDFLFDIHGNPDDDSSGDKETVDGGAVDDLEPAEEALKRTNSENTEHETPAPHHGELRLATTEPQAGSDEGLLPTTESTTTESTTTTETKTGGTTSPETRAHTGHETSPFDSRSIDLGDGYAGLLIIGDPHLEARVPGFRKDDYPRTILAKLRWALDYAKQEKLFPLILGDLFQLPRNNPNWLIVELLEMFDQPIAGVYGNHDVHESELNTHDSLSILCESNRLILLSERQQLKAKIGSRTVVIGGTSWGRNLPHELNLTDVVDPLVVWLSHHDLIVPGYEEVGNVKLDVSLPFDILINGHIHRRLENYHLGKTTVLTPGNITRRKRSDATRDHRPSVLRIDIDRDRDIEQDGWRHDFIEVPHRPFDEVFHSAIVDSHDEGDQPSAFVTGLKEMLARRTETGAGLQSFLESNLETFDEPVADEIRALAKQVLNETA